jgi:hypothetical protein
MVPQIVDYLEAMSIVDIACGENYSIAVTSMIVIIIRFSSVNIWLQIRYWTSLQLGNE